VCEPAERHCSGGVGLTLWGTRAGLRLAGRERAGVGSAAGRVDLRCGHTADGWAFRARQDGWTYGAGTPPMGGPSAERFDFGPEATTRAHPTLWVGPWEAEVAKELMI